MSEKPSLDRNNSMNQIWRALSDADRGLPVESDPVDPATAATIRHLHALGVSSPPASSRERVRQAVRATIHSADGNERMQPMNQALHANVMQPAPNWNGRIAQPEPASWTRTPAKRKRWFWAQVSLAAAIILMLGGFWRFSENGEPGKGSNLPAVLGSPIPAAVATPDPATMLGTLVDAMLPGGVSGLSQYVDIERWNYPANDSATLYDLLTSNSVLFVLKGQITATISTPSQVQKGLGATGPRTVAKNVAQVLNAGDAVAIGPGSILRVLHNGNVPAITLELTIFDPNLPGPFQTHVSFQQLVNGAAVFPAGPLHLVLQRESLAPQQTVPGPAAGVTQLVALETPVTPSKLQSGNNGSVTNVDTKPLIVLVMTISPVGSATATPTS